MPCRMPAACISPVLDAHPEAVPAGRYQLEVSSPGIERTLRTPEQFRRYIGTEITVKTSEPVAGARRHRGRICRGRRRRHRPGARSDPGGRLRLRFDQMNRARTVMVWGPRLRARRPVGPPPGRQRPAASRVPA